MDNLAIARILAEIGDLLEIKGENPFKIRAYRTASDTIAHETRRIADLSPAERLALPGIGKDIAAKVGQLVDAGRMPYHEELLEQFPTTILDLLQLQGVGPKTVARLYGDLRVSTLAELERAARDGRIRAMKGMGAKKEALILKALEEQRRFVGRRLTAEAHETAAALVGALREHAPSAHVAMVGSLRRGCETCGDLDILAAGAPPSIIEAFTNYTLVERILAHGDTKCSVRIAGGFQADLRLVPHESLGAALQYFTGSKAHNIALRDRAIRRGFKLNEYGLYRVEDEERVAGETEESLYAALGLAFVEPELRENRGEIEAAGTGALPSLAALQCGAHLRGDVSNPRETPAHPLVAVDVLFRNFPVVDAGIARRVRVRQRDSGLQLLRLNVDRNAANATDAQFDGGYAAKVGRPVVLDAGGDIDCLSLDVHRDLKNLVRRPVPAAPRVQRSADRDVQSRRPGDSGAHW